ncbi:hypothetical protein COL5a_010151 [Colletotrichum fioriniae]|uniref:uncharacterized protein n=1 Tax=Colletotrichum fioriniae TaxID=710243 RepID=UPI0032DBA6D3|nr:hypothetical protein COL5a_010151 [Colletotrichum fioriniae]KAJ3942620.1 hypothetical protein N0V96_006839 [Colletotrichum fioriniae]
MWCLCASEATSFPKPAKTSLTFHDSCYASTSCFNTACVNPTAIHTRRSADNAPGGAAVDFSAASVTVKLERATETQRC